MKKYIISLLIIPIIACSNLIKEEDLIQNDGRTFIYKKNNKLASGISRSDTGRGILKRKYDDGIITSISYNNIEFPIEDAQLNGSVHIENQEFIFKNGSLVKEINNKNELYFIQGIPQSFNEKFLQLIPYYDYDFFNVYNRGIISNSMYKNNELSININFSKTGILEEINYRKGKLSKQYEFIKEGKNIGRLKSYKEYTAGKLEGRAYKFDGKYHILYEYKDGLVRSINIYNYENNRVSTFKYNKKNTISFFEYYTDTGQIKCIGYFDFYNNRIGRWAYFYPSGNTKEYREYINNSLAYFNRYYENGIKKVIGIVDIENDIYTGNIQYFSPEGELIYTELYNNYGELLEVNKLYD